MEFKWLCIAFMAIICVSTISNCVKEINCDKVQLEQLQHKVDSVEAQLDTLSMVVYD